MVVQGREKERGLGKGKVGRERVERGKRWYSKVRFRRKCS